MNSLKKKLKSDKGESLAEAMAAMVLLAFAILLFSAMVIQSSRLMNRGSKSMDYYYRGQEDLNGRSTDGNDVRTGEGTLQIKAKNGENAFAALTPALRTGEGNDISVKVYRQSLDWNAALKSSNAADSEDAAKTGNVLFTYDLNTN